MQNRLVVALALVGACAPADGPESSVLSVDTLPNGAIHVRNGVVGHVRQSVAWNTTQTLKIGAIDDSDLNYVFGSIWDVTCDAAGRVYVLDQQANNVRVFSETGEHIRTLGRDGGGPGEFAYPIGLTWDANGHLWVADARNARYTVFDTSGALVATFPRQIGGYGYNWGGGFDNTGVDLYEPSFFRDRETGESRSVYLRLRTEGSVAIADTLVLPRAVLEESYYRMERETGSTIVSIPFAPQHTWVFDGVAGIWSGVTDQYRLYHTALDGDTLLIVEAGYDPISIDDAELAESRSRYEEYGQAHWNAIRERVADVKPPILNMTVDDRGYVWVVRSRPSSAEGNDHTFDVFSPSGRYLTSLDIPVGIYPRPRIVGDRIVGVYRDELDVSYVVAFRIEGRGEGR